MKFYYFLSLLIGIMLLFHFGGVDLPSNGLLKNTNILNSSNDASLENIKGSTLYGTPDTKDRGTFYWILMVGVIAGVAVGLFTGAPPIQYVTAVLVFTLVGLGIADWIALYSKLNMFGGWISAVVLTLFGIIIVGFIISGIEWWVGTD
ncbi:MAG TPA: hypothetical protein ENG87_00505 [Candidatus Pacearchaeota archaeon]|nr:hypothetical protein BMS3Abin17_00089 [archaeon BMS3Abin17]HDK41829.1 hypothetical protein [Candidatus Pacearchaeota archaeon]HDZ60163.1 hypothetical protein [Candidatus Pacearchaeota archaeon]